MLETLISSKTRVKLLLKFFLNSETVGYLRGLESEFSESSNAIRIELNKLESANLLSSTLEGNKKIFKANVQHPYYADIHSILLRYTGLTNIIDQVVCKLGDLERVYVIGDLAKGKVSDIVSLVFVGNIDKVYLKRLIVKVQNAIGKKIIYSCSVSSLYDKEIEMKSAKDYLLLWSR